jgi:hypothetical protein
MGVKQAAVAASSSDSVSISDTEDSKDPIATAFMVLLAHLNRSFNTESPSKFHRANGAGAAVL